MTRDQFLKATLYEVIKARNEGINVDTYCHWSLIDNYEWTSFEPRFGLFGVDYHDNARRLTTDAFGTNAGGCYKLFVEAFKNKDQKALREAFVTTQYPLVSVR